MTKLPEKLYLPVFRPAEANIGVVINQLIEYLAEREKLQTQTHFTYKENKTVEEPNGINGIYRIPKPPWVKEDHAWNVAYEQGIADASKALGVEIILTND